ncbi:MAG: DUF433 domain-containing protein [Pirellulales bacterium]|nr:DUF433 domain-containing protein [Pirellulales bacterium]
MFNWSHCPAVTQNPAIYSGAWVVSGTRVPVALFENLETGATVHDLVE